MKSGKNNSNDNNNVKSKRRLKYTPNTFAASMSLSENKNKISTPRMYNSPSDCIDSPPTPEIRQVESIVDQLTPRRIPDKRRKLLVKSLFSFGVESLDDLKGFTYEELRQEMTLYAFTGVQLKRLLRKAQEYEEEQSMVLNSRQSISSNNSRDRKVIVTRKKKKKLVGNKKESYNNTTINDSTMYDNNSRSILERGNDNSGSNSVVSVIGAIIVGAVVAFGVHTIVTTAVDAIERNYDTSNNNEEATAKK